MIEQAVPTTINSYIGQEKAKELLTVVLSSTKRKMKELMMDRGSVALNNSAMFMSPSILIIGPPGYGKTRLAQIYFEEINRLAQTEKWPIWAIDDYGNANYGTNVWSGPGLPNEPYFFAEIEGKDILNSNILDHYFYYLQIQGVLFIDEFQNIPRKLHDHFLKIMSEQKYYSKIANRVMDHYGFTLMGATTHEAKISRAFRERFKLTIVMEQYTEEQIKQIILYYVNKLQYSIDDEAVELLINRSRDNPRTITQNLDMLFLMKEDKIITSDDAKKATELRGVGEFGLTSRDVNILRILYEHGSTGAETLSNLIDAVDVKNYLETERYLVNRGYIIPTRKGRELTSKGKEIIKGII